jgi:succinate-semialdehyde dehydrogenase
MDVKTYIAEYVKRARIAQKEFESYTQEQVDQLVKTIAKTIYDNAEELAKLAVEETGMGNYEDKVQKNKGKARIIWNNLKNKKSVGIINRNEETGIVEIAKPVGVVGAITPCTNPIVTPMCNAMFALKGRNTIIFTPHHRAVRSSTYAVDLINQALKKHNAPENLIQILRERSREHTRELISAVDVVVATGGMGMVKAAYSSGKPAYGVGAGNVQCIIDRDVDFEEAVPKIILGRTFDNGIICSGEQTVIAHEDDYDQVIEIFKKNGAYYVDDPQEKELFRKALFVDGVMNRHAVGQSVQTIAELAGVKVPPETKVILIEADGVGDKDVLCKEKMCPVMATFRYKDFKEAVQIAQKNLDLEGKGHSVAIHSNTKEHIEYAGTVLTISRLVVNQPSATTAGGSFYNGFAPTTTLGCGSWGNNSISENLDYKHLLNISRIGYYKEDAYVPSDEELWG